MGYHPYRFSHRRVTILYGNETSPPRILWNSANLTAVVNAPLPPDDLKELVCEACEALSMLFNENVTTGHKAIDSFFNSFTPTSQALLVQRRTLDAARHWVQLLILVREWEKQSGKTVHKGTPYYFLGASYIYGYGIDLGFRYVYDAIEEDRKLGTKVGDPAFYRNAPAYRLVSLFDNPNNFLYNDVILPARQRVELFLKAYRNTGVSSMQLRDFESRFLNNSDMELEMLFFVYVLLEMLKLEKSWSPGGEPNNFSRMKNMRVVFDLCLIIDEVLRKRHSSATYISQGVYELCKSRGWVNNADRNSGDLNRSLTPNISGDNAPPPDVVVPALLNGTLNYRNAPVRSEMSWLLLAWHLRNYAAHDLTPQKVLAERYPEIAQALMNALFMSVE